jgi:Ca2+-dependent lipid-binding protein
MKANNNKVNEYHSMEEYENKFFPDFKEKRLLEATMNPYEDGVALAKMSLDKIKTLLELTK